ncbi:MAG: bifunctional alpha,alpha-trehalose-phosphate synthase (UDP-forming)/trehalose-phosphatase [Phycisphaerae bacterium]|nr:bifunctional alpha,alpha-trehalose-phosphate synthase (UDP-forming)/trehalose-phosphatase [Phycisphaerae bacterium]MDD5381912.1 bifunctional alpha,alpha-trehalose-phosphate synthase (UDP-forming)/trehalose-phosphatase [Phycisphaerae bacterium]
MLITVSNRLPVNVTKRSNALHLQPSAGGLVTGLHSLCESYQNRWVGWPAIAADKTSEQEKHQISDQLRKQNWYPVFLSAKDIRNYYNGFCNKTIWPLFHYFPLYTVYEERYWQAYTQVNKAFCDAVVKIAGPDDHIWIHDYHLMLLPELIRKQLPNAQIGFFLHIPFPSFELFRLLPWRGEILNGLLGADLIGFHTYDYVRHFLSSTARIKGTEHSMGALTIGDRVIKVDAFPMGIDYEKYSNAAKDSKVGKALTTIRKKVSERKIILSIDRLDYTKGIVQRLEAFDLFLSQNAKYKKKVTLILVAVPSRTDVGDYVELRKQVEGLVGRINGEHGAIGWVPVWYLYCFIPFERLVALYNIADVALVTPLRDGMNLIAKEFVAAKTDGRGVLILSEMAGAASELGEAIVVNTNNKQAIIDAMKEALEMPVEEQIDRNRSMQKRLSRYTVKRWAHDFVEALAGVRKIQQELSVCKLDKSLRQRLGNEYDKSSKRLFLLDYDGTLVGFADRPEKATPDKDLFTLLQTLAADSKNEIVIISGRDKATLTRWLGTLNASLIAEHGAWIKEKEAADWQVIEPLRNDWKQTIRPIIELYTDRTPGSFVEEKDFSLVWHFRKSNPELARLRVQELKNAVLGLTENMDIGVFEGNKILEVKNLAINKGQVAKLWINKQKWGFIFAAGDDYTDEDLFAVLPESAYSIRVGYGISHARFNLDSVHELRLLLEELIKK